MANDVIAGTCTLFFNGTKLPLKSKPSFFPSGEKAEIIEGNTEAHGYMNTFQMAKATNVIISKTTDVDVASLKAARDADVVFVLPSGAKFNMSGAVINGDLSHNTENGEIDLGEIQSKVGYWVE